MTDAYVPIINDTNCDDQKPLQQSELQNSNIMKDTSQDCVHENITSSGLTQDQDTAAVIKTVADISNTIAQNDTNKLSQDDTQRVNITINDCIESNTQNEIKDNDTILKYVYKKNNKLDNSQKGAGHPKNSLKRKKRSESHLVTSNDTAPHGSHRAPLIVNYKTSHRPGLIEVPDASLREHATGAYAKNLPYSNSHEPLTERTTGNIIKNSNLADFNIETLHDKEISSKNNDNRNTNSKSVLIDEGNSQQQSSNSEESKEKYSQNRSNKNSEESAERGDSRYLKNSNPYQNDDRTYSGSEESKESKEKESYSQKYYNPQHTEGSSESNEKDKYSKKRTSSNESQESYERENKDLDRNKKLTHPKSSSSSSEESQEFKNKDSSESTETLYAQAGKHKPKVDSKESNERFTDYGHEKSSSGKDYPKNYDLKKSKNKEDGRSLHSDEVSGERYEKQSNNEPRSYVKDESKDVLNKSSPFKIQEVDLGDFSYETIKVNDKGQVVPASDSHDKYEIDSSKDVKQSSAKPKVFSGEVSEQLSSSAIDKNIPSSTESKENNKDVVNINDGEIRPVVEINSDTNSDEFTEVENTKDPFKTNLDKKSLETFLGVKELHSDEQNEKLQNAKEEDNGDVKEQFERIPLNYKHDENENKPDKENNNSETPQKNINLDNQEITPNEGSLETLPTQEPQYDEKLNFKFDDVTVTLPEIKLPDDIFAYAYEEPYQKQEKENRPRQKFYHYSNERSDEDDRKKKNEDKDNQDDYADKGYENYYNNYKEKDDYKKKDDDGEAEEEEEEGVDLYEKFVRERFGKRGTFAQRSDKIQEERPIANNAQLYDRIQNILKKTEDVKKQAEKSGDPNAGYMWTLEYGQNL